MLCHLMGRSRSGWRRAVVVRGVKLSLARTPASLSTTLGNNNNNQRNVPSHCRFSSSSTPSSSASSARKEKLRVAIVGGGCAGLSAALHLAPLVEEGMIASPIDIFDASSHDGGKEKGRDIGVGLWTTALDPLGKSSRESHQTVYQQLTQDRISTWLSHVGYRTPNGSWLMRSKLPDTWKEHMDKNKPGLLFMRERDLLYTLLKAVLWEENLGTLKLHRTSHSSVAGVAHDEWWDRGQIQHPWSGKLELLQSNQNSATPTENSERDYHLIVAADGTNSNIRSKYGGHEAMLNSAASTTLSSPSMDVSLSSAQSSWSDVSYQEAIGIQDRNYTVFRGNAPITSEELNALDPKAKLDNTHHVSFQTWGTHKSMRFATVPLFCPPRTRDTSDGSSSNQHKEHQVWFITVNDSSIAEEHDPAKRRDLLLEHFKDWHEPIRTIVKATDPESILMERAIAHRHCMGPILNLNRILQKQHQMEHGAAARISAGGPGPAVVFLGDAYMTVDPILAQGFTVAMEGSANLHQSVRRALTTETPDLPPPLAFDPYALRDELSLRHEARMDRLICLLRVTELVQSLGQPEGGSVLGSLNTHVLRPITKLTPNLIKRPIFDRVLNYSLGL